jgi:hypothetical protein
MSKAEQRALEKYPLLADDDKEGLEALKYIGMECDCASEYNEVQESKQAYFIEGYHQAEKDNELSWEDMRELHIIFAEIDVDIELYKTNIKTETLGYYQEVLKRFKERKEK